MRAGWIAGLSVLALVGLSRGRRWGGIVDVLQWVVIWLPFWFGLQQFSADAFAISTAVSVVGALVGVLAFVVRGDHADSTPAELAALPRWSPM